MDKGKMRTKIPDKFKPTAQSYDNLRKHGAIPDFVDDQLDAFITYWQETGEKKKSWQMTLQTWMRRAWQGKAGREWEERRHRNQNLAGRGMKPDLFDTMLDKINGSASSVATDDEPQRDRTTYPGQRAATPAAAAPMDPLEALRQAREILEG